MATWLMLLLCMFEGYVPPDYEEIDYPALKAARESYKSQLALINLQKAAAVEKKTQTISLQHVVSATEGPTVHYLVTGPNCAPCVKRKAYLQSIGAIFTEISVEEARSMGQVVTYIPVEFDKASTMSATVVAVDAPPSANALLFVVQDHLLAQCEGHTYASFFQFDVDVPDSLPTLINQLMTKQTWSNGTATVNWSGNRTIGVQPEKITFTPPPAVSVKYGVLSYKTSMKQISVKQGGKQIEIEFVACPNITVNFK